jgi:hypothetical protein
MRVKAVRTPKAGEAVMSIRRTGGVNHYLQSRFIYCV